MKPYRMWLAAAAAVTVAGCASTGKVAPINFPLTVQNNAAGSDAERFAAAFTSGAMATHAFHTAGSGEAGTILATIDSIRPIDPAEPARGFTYVASWSRDGKQIGRQEDDCLADEVKVCAREAAESMYAQVYYYDRSRKGR